MSVERPIHLDVSVPGFAPPGGESSGRGGLGRGQADSQARQRFEEALAKPPEAATGDKPALATQPFALFGSVPVRAVIEEQPPAPPIGEMVERLMVDDGSHGGKQVRMELKDDLLPGVTVAIQELEGRVQVDFLCSVESSRLRLEAAAPDQARQLAERLQRAVLLRIQTDDEDDPCLFEAAGLP